MMTKQSVLIVGTGSIGERHARCFLNSGVSLVGIVEPNADTRGAVASRYNIGNTYSSLPDALEDEKWSTAVICTPAQTHLSLAEQCLDASLTVLIEKPLAINTREAHAFAMRCDSSKIGVAYVHRAHPALQDMRRVLNEGAYGRPLQLIANCGQHFPTYRPAYASTYYANHASGGGAIQDALTHIINSAEWLVGPITRIAVDAQHLALPDVTVEDTVHAIARHGDIMASYTLNQHQAPNEVSLTLVCEKGTLRLEMHRSRWRCQTVPKGEWRDHDFNIDTRDTLFNRQAESWLKAADAQTQPLCTLEEGLQTLAVNEAAIWSSQNQAAWRDVASTRITPQESIA